MIKPQDTQMTRKITNKPLVPTLQRGNAVCNAPALRIVTLEHQVCIATLERGNEVRLC